MSVLSDILDKAAEKLEVLAIKGAKHAGKQLSDFGVPASLSEFERTVIRPGLIGGPTKQVSSKGFIEAWFPNIQDKTLVGADLDRRLKLNSGVATRVGIGGLILGSAGAINSVANPMLPPPVFYNDKSGNPRHVNDMGVGPNYASRMLGNNSQARYDAIAGRRL